VQDPLKVNRTSKQAPSAVAIKVDDGKITAIMNAFLQCSRNARYLFILLISLVYSPTQAADSNKISQQKISKRQITKLADQYIDAIKSEDVDAWKTLLTPLHADDTKLNEEAFLNETSRFKSITIEQVEGLDVELKIKHQDGSRSSGILQLNSSGHIKYTPFLFKHPVHEICTLLETLLRDETSLMGSSVNAATRYEIAGTLFDLKVPLCGYNPTDPSVDRRRDCVIEIIAWLTENGKTFDSTEPKVYLSPSEFSRCIEEIKSQI
jgi:hypothetical protein